MAFLPAQENRRSSGASLQVLWENIKHNQQKGCHLLNGRQRRLFFGRWRICVRVEAESVRSLLLIWRDDALLQGARLSGLCIGWLIGR